MEEEKFDKVLGKIYLLYYKSKIALGEAHLMRSPKNYLQKFKINLPFNCDLDILDYLITKRSSIHSELSNKSWILYVLEITKILSYNESFGIGKLYNQILNKNIKVNISLNSFKPILALIDTQNKNPLVENLKILRDKHYAHTDKEVECLTNRLFPTYNEAWELMFLVEDFLTNIYYERDSDIDLGIDRHLFNYLSEFKITYQYFKMIDDMVEKNLLRRYFSEERCHAYFNSQE